LQEQLRYLSHQILSTQEEERKRISRELHDQIAAALTAINIELAALKDESAGNDKVLKRRIASTQRLVQHSVEIIHAFARDLRPTTLDDLGLIPALHSFTKALSKRSRIHVRLKIFAAVEDLDNSKRTVLYRVTQEALTNVVKHAKASRVEVNIGKAGDAVALSIHDDGTSFEVERLLYNPKNKRLGLLGMRERVEMVGGSFHVQSAPGKGTTVHATIPIQNNRANGSAKIK
jgi:signal transduction histidine kinase